MSRRSDAGPFDFLLGFLAAYRILFYLGGLLFMSVPLVVEWTTDVTVPQPVRNAIVAVSFGLLLLTYLAERRVGLDHVDPATGSPREPYSRRTRVTVVLAIGGIAIGVYLLAIGNVGMGLLFLGGALLFFQLAYRADRTDGSTTADEERARG